MSLSDRIQKDLVAAMKAREAARVGLLRLVKSALKNKEIELKAELSPEAEVQLMQMLVKQRNEAIEIFDNAGRKDLATRSGASASYSGFTSPRKRPRKRSSTSWEKSLPNLKRARPRTLAP
jgi:uncharacterized protein YqeY